MKLPTFLREYRKLAAQCAPEGSDHPDYLLRLAELELIDRHQRMVERRIRAARFPAVKSLDTFDFLVIPSVNKALVMELARCEYIERRENVIAVGNSGTGPDPHRPGPGPCRLPEGNVGGFHHRTGRGPAPDGNTRPDRHTHRSPPDGPIRAASDHAAANACSRVRNDRHHRHDRARRPNVPALQR